MRFITILWWHYYKFCWFYGRRKKHCSYFSIRIQIEVEMKVCFFLILRVIRFICLYYKSEEVWKEKINSSRTFIRRNKFVNNTTNEAIGSYTCKNLQKITFKGHSISVFNKYKNNLWKPKINVFFFNFQYFSFMFSQL